MSKNASSATTNETYEDIRREQEATPPDASGLDELLFRPKRIGFSTPFSVVCFGFARS